VETKQFCFYIVKVLRDLDLVVHQQTSFIEFRHFVKVFGVELLLGFVADVGVEENSCETPNKAFIFVVSDSASLIDNRNHGLNDFVLNLFVFVEYAEYLVFGDVKVFHTEVVLVVPADWALVLPSDQQTVEQSACKQNAHLLDWFDALVDFVLVDRGVCIQHHLLDFGTSFHCQLDAFLQNAYGEIFSGGSGQEQPEFIVDLRVFHIFNQFLQFGHPRVLQVGVLIHQPQSFFGGLAVERDGNLVLALS